MNADRFLVRVDVKNKFRHGGDRVLGLALHDVDLPGGHIEHLGELADLRALLVHDRRAEKIGDGRRTSLRAKYTILFLRSIAPFTSSTSAKRTMSMPLWTRDEATARGAPSM